MKKDSSRKPTKKPAEKGASRAPSAKGRAAKAAATEEAPAKAPRASRAKSAKAPATEPRARAARAATREPEPPPRARSRARAESDETPPARKRATTARSPRRRAAPVESAPSVESPPPVDAGSVEVAESASSVDTAERTSSMESAESIEAQEAAPPVESARSVEARESAPSVEAGVFAAEATSAPADEAAEPANAPIADEAEAAAREAASIAAGLADELFLEDAALDAAAEAPSELDADFDEGEEEADELEADEEEPAPRPPAEPNLFSDEARGPRAAADPASRAAAAADAAAARAFWDAPDDGAPVPAPSTSTPAPSTSMPAPSTSAPAPVAAVPAPAASAQPRVEGAPGEGGGRRRRRRRRRRGRVETELPIDTPEMAAVAQRLRRQFGLRAFRPGQERVIRNVLAKKDTLAVMPTGSGKSLTFQLPAMVLDGVTVVVSPLLALMKDQTDKLRRRGVVAARLDSTLTTKGERETLQAIEEGAQKLVYVTPERAGSSDFKDELGGRPVELFVIDEAHCVSQWGHDFRPSYLNLRRAIESLAVNGSRPPVLALTATATPRVVEDIKERLGMQEPDVVHLGFARPELIFEVRAVADEKAQVKRLLRLVRRIKGSGIVYCSTINTVEALAGALPRLGLRVGKYHGKMTKQERDTEQHRFMRNQVRVMIATNAFGLGVDKPDIRFVLHYNLPGSVEQYYQEAGRAGRDGKPARCVLLWRPGDEEVQQHFNTQKYPGRDQVRAVTQALLAGPGKASDIAMRAGVPVKKAQVVLVMLEEGHLARALAGDIWAPSEETADEQMIWNAAETYRKKRESDRERLQAMLDYANSRKCRVAYLMGYFGQEVGPCGRCDNCTGKNAAEEEPDEDEAPARALPELPSLPPPPRKDPTTMF